jgi:hypothetical protein
MSGDAKCAERFLYALFATVVKPISDFRLLISAFCLSHLASPRRRSSRGKHLE